MITSKIKITGEPIWKELFNVRIKAKDIPSENELRMFGLPTVKDKHYDHIMHNSLTDVCISINAMVEYYKKGITIHVVKERDTVTIFNIITNYLSAWLVELQYEVNMASAPLDDLLLLDEFCGVVYPHASPIMSLDQSLRTRLFNIGNSNTQNVRLNRLKKKIETPNQPQQDTYNSVSRALTEKSISRNSTLPEINKRQESTDNANEPFSFKPSWSK